MSASAPAAEARNYYGRPVIKPPVWTWEVPTYFFVGGVAGASATLAAAADRRGLAGLARVARRTAMAGSLLSPVLLISDLGRPERFLHMLRVVKPTSPMSVGTWILVAFAPAAVGGALLAELRWLPWAQRTLQALAATLGPAMATYTGVLVANTAVPAWHEARVELPALFAAGATAAAGAVGALAAPAAEVGPARRLAVIGAVGELAVAQVMERRLGELAEPYHRGPSGRLSRLATGLTAAGAALLVAGRHRRGLTLVGAMLTLSGAFAERWAVFEAGDASARDPKYTVAPQRARADRLTA